MNNGKGVYAISVILYSIIAEVTSKLVNIDFIHVFNALMLSSILCNLLDWKYGVIEGEEIS